MKDVNVAFSGTSAIVEFITMKAKNWYADNIPGVPAVPPNSVVIGIISAEDLVKKMVKAGLIVTREEG